MTYHQPIQDNGKPYGTYPALPIENGILPHSLYRHFTNLFAAFYHQPAFDINDTDIAVLLPEVIEIMAVANYLGSARVVTTMIENLLLKQGQMLYRSISDAPLQWAALSFRIRSETVFREAIIHAVGQWTTLANDVIAGTYNSIPASVLHVVRQKAYALMDVKRVTECRIMGYYPPHLHKPLPYPSAAAPKITDYGTDILAWMAMAYFRHWMAQHICGDRSRLCPDGGALLYRAIASGAAGLPTSVASADAATAEATAAPQPKRKKRKTGTVFDDDGLSTYLPRADLEIFCRRFPLSAKAVNLLDDQLKIIKQALVPYVADLVVNRSALDTKDYPIWYLTCCEVTREDIPWLIPGFAATEQEHWDHAARRATVGLDRPSDPHSLAEDLGGPSNPFHRGAPAPASASAHDHGSDEDHAAAYRIHNTPPPRPVAPTARNVLRPEAGRKHSLGEAGEEDEDSFGEGPSKRVRRGAAEADEEEDGEIVLAAGKGKGKGRQTESRAGAPREQGMREGSSGLFLA